MHLDIETVQVVTLFVTFVSGWLLLFAWLPNRRLTSLAMWGVGCVAASSGEFLMIERANLPSFLFVDLAGGLILLGYGLIWSGLRQFAGNPVVGRLVLGPILIWLAACRLGWLGPNSDIHVIVLLLSLAAYLIAGSYEVWRSDSEVISRWPAVIFLLAKAAAYMTAAVLQNKLPPPLGHATEVPYWIVFVYFGFLLIVCTLIFLAICMAKERIELDYRRASQIDSLTGIANRRAFFNVGNRLLQRTLAERKPVAILLMDLDAFKRVNENYGHQIGDRVLRNFSESVRATLRGKDYFGRLGGQEFACLLPGVAEAQAHLVAERIRVGCEDQRIMRGSARYLGATVSIGIVVAHAPGYSLDTLLADANLALYQAKAKGRNRVEQVKASGAVPDERNEPSYVHNGSLQH